MITFADYFCTNEDCLLPQFIPRFYITETLTGDTESWGQDWDNIYDLKWSPDGTRLAVVGSNLSIYDAFSGEPITGWENIHTSIYLVEWSSDNKYLLGISSLNKVQIYDVEEQTLHSTFDTLNPSLASIEDALWLDQTQRLFLATISGNLSVWNTD